MTLISRINSVWIGLIYTSSVIAEEYYELEELVVTATAITEEVEKGSASRLTAEDLLKRGSVSLPDILQREPGVSVPFDVSGVDPLVPFLQGGSSSINV